MNKGKKPTQFPPFIFLSFIPSSLFHTFVAKENEIREDMKQPTKRLRWTEAYKLMNAKDESGRQKPFDIRFVCLDGHIVEVERAQKVVSYNKRTGMRRIILENGDFRNIYDVLILQINDTRILVS